MSMPAYPELSLAPDLPPPPHTPHLPSHPPAASGFAFSPAPLRRPTTGLQLLQPLEEPLPPQPQQQQQLPASAPAAPPSRHSSGSGEVGESRGTPSPDEQAATLHHPSLYERLQAAVAGHSLAGSADSASGCLAAAATTPPAGPSGAATPPLAPTNSRSGSGLASPQGSIGGSRRQSREVGGSCGSSRRTSQERPPSRRGARERKGMFGESYPSPWRDPRWEGRGAATAVAAAAAAAAAAAFFVCRLLGCWLRFRMPSWVLEALGAHTGSPGAGATWVLRAWHGAWHGPTQRGHHPSQPQLQAVHHLQRPGQPLPGPAAREQRGGGCDGGGGPG